MMLLALVSTLSVTASIVGASGQVLAKEAPSLQPRVSFQGGWPIEADTCPSNTTSCEGTGSCCPGSTNCYTEGLAGVAVCCPTTNSCYDTAKSIPVCADPTWTLYTGNYDYFCCSTGQVGILPDIGDDAGSGLCVQSGSNVASTALATPYNAPGGTGSPRTQTSSIPATTTAGAAGGEATTSAGTTATLTVGTTTFTESNDSAKPSSISIVGIIIGFLLIPFEI